MRIAKLTAVLFALTALVAVPAHADTTEVVRVYHQAATSISTTGSGVGAVRTFFIPIAVDGKSANGQYLTGTLTTFAENVSGGLEVRGSNLTFVFGEEANQLVVGGISLYPPAGATLAPGQRTVRPVIGGSGEYFGARGQVVSVNMGSAGWTHTFRIVLPE